MINLIHGPRGSGKTKAIIDSANSCITKTKGNVVFIGDLKYASSVNTQARYFYVNEYRISGAEQTLGFIKGILAGNFDITDVFVDGILRITGELADNLRGFFEELEYLSMQSDVDFTVTLSTEKIPVYLQKYI